jgi:hypothetical protein
MAKVYVGATIDPDLYNSVRKKFPKLTDTTMVNKALTMLLEGESLSKEEKEFISLLREKTDQTKENVLGVLKGERRTWKYTFGDYDKVANKFKENKEFGDMSTLISLLLWAWSINKINFYKVSDGWRVLE